MQRSCIKRGCWVYTAAQQLSVSGPVHKHDAALQAHWCGLCAAPNITASLHTGVMLLRAAESDLYKIDSKRNAVRCAAAFVSACRMFVALGSHEHGVYPVHEDAVGKIACLLVSVNARWPALQAADLPLQILSSMCQINVVGRIRCKPDHWSQGGSAVGLWSTLGNSESSTDVNALRPHCSPILCKCKLSLLAFWIHQRKFPSN